MIRGAPKWEDDMRLVALDRSIVVAIRPDGEIVIDNHAVDIRAVRANAAFE